jgi:hypothetical protein
MELSDEDVAKLLAKDIDKHKSKAVPVDAAIKDHFFRGSTAVILYRFGRGAFAIQKWYPWYPLFPFESRAQQFQAAYCVGATRGLFGGKRIGDKASAAERCLLQ